LKGNQPLLLEGVKLLFEEPISKLTGARQRSWHGNRHEVRELLVSSDLNAWADWPYLGQVGQLTYTCECKGKVSRETSYLITSLSPQEASAGKLLTLMRGQKGNREPSAWGAGCDVRRGSLSGTRRLGPSGHGGAAQYRTRAATFERTTQYCFRPAQPCLAREAGDRTCHERERIKK
jgi:hypothetical protein